MRYLSVCSGIEAATVAWHDLGWSPVAFSEIEAFPGAVLRTHYPDVPNWGDMTKFQEWPDADVDLLVGGTPCQSFSVAGLRKGLADPRGNLALTYLAIADKYRPRWLVWENVPGVLSSAGGRDFGAFLGGLGKLGYGWAYRVLDAQYFGVAQRRRRVFVVGCLGGWQRAAAVLFERASLLGHPAPRREAGEDAPDRPSTRAAISSGRGVVTPAHAFDARQSHVVQYGDPTGPLDTQGHSVGVLHPVAIQGSLINCGEGGPNGVGVSDDGVMYTLTGRHVHGVALDVAHTLDQAQGQAVALPAMAVRRLTPRECERLQGFPDDYTLISYRGKPAADGPRYKALGNSMAVPVMRWIGQRLQAVDGMTE